jgi:hypothetical protein
MLALFIGAAIYLNQQVDSEGVDATPTVVEEDSFVFDDMNVVSSIEVIPADGQTVHLERNEEDVWVLKQPFETEADQGLAEAAATQVNALRITNELEADPSSLGLDTPAFVITIEFYGDARHTLEIGDRTPTNFGYYVRLNNQRTLIVTASGIDALINLTSNPPYLNTPAPTATDTPPPTETPAPPTETESTPEAGETPQS